MGGLKHEINYPRYVFRGSASQANLRQGHSMREIKLFKSFALFTHINHPRRVWAVISQPLTIDYNIIIGTFANGVGFG